MQAKFILVFVFSSLIFFSSMNFLVQRALYNSVVNKEAGETPNTYATLFLVGGKRQMNKK